MTEATNKKAKTVVIVGGGFGGLNCAKALGGQRGVNVLLIDRRNYHLFQPLLYQVAMAGLSPAEIASPIRSLLARHKNIEVLLTTAKSLDLKNKVVTADCGSFDYNYLVLAGGSNHSYFGHEQWEPYAPGLKTIEQATEIRRRVLLAFEMAECESDPKIRKDYLTFIIVGGGPTGVELAGALGEISRFTLTTDFRNIDPSQTRIILIEAGDRILPSFSLPLARKAMRALESFGIQVWTNSIVTEVTSSGVKIGQEFISAKTVLWAAGVQPSVLNQQLGTPLDGQGRAIVNSDLSLPDHPDVFVIGDQAHFNNKNGRPLPGLAPVALQQGRHVGKNILRELAGKERLPFHYRDKGQMATVGRAMAVMEMHSFKASGFLAWLAWLFVHIYYLIGFKNRIFVLLQWAWHYLTYKRGARLIVHKKWTLH